MLLSYGLVSIPRRLWQNGNLPLRLKYFEYEASNLDERLIEAKYQLDETVKLVYTATQMYVPDPTLKAHIGVIEEKCPLDMMEHFRLMKASESKAAEDELGFITEERLVQLHRSLKYNLSEYTRASW